MSVNIRQTITVIIISCVAILSVRCFCHLSDTVVVQICRLADIGKASLLYRKLIAFLELHFKKGDFAGILLYKLLARGHGQRQPHFAAAAA